MSSDFFSYLIFSSVGSEHVFIACSWSQTLTHEITHTPMRLSVQHIETGKSFWIRTCNFVSILTMFLFSPFFTSIVIWHQFHHRVRLLAAPFRWATRGTGHVNDIHNCCVRHRFAEQRLSVVVLVQSAHYLRLCHFIDHIGVCGIVRSGVAHVHRTNSIFSELGSRFADSDWLHR